MEENHDGSTYAKGFEAFVIQDELVAGLDE